MTEPPTDSVLPRRTFLGCAGAATTVVVAGCSSSTGRAAEVATPFTVPASEIPLGAGKIFQDRGVVITQPSPAEFQAFSTICPHQGCTVNGIDNGMIRCPCHNSLFRITDGSPERGPARKPLARLQATLDGTDVRVS